MLSSVRNTPAVFFNNKMKLSQYIAETRAELRHVNWPTRSQTLNYTIMVIAVSVAVALMLGIADFVFSKLLTLLF